MGYAKNAIEQWTSENRSQIIKDVEKNGLTLEWFNSQKPRLASVLTTIKLYGKRFLSAHDIDLLYSIRNFVASILLNKKENKQCFHKRESTSSIEHLGTLIRIQKILR